MRSCKWGRTTGAGGGEVVGWREVEAESDSQREGLVVQGQVGRGWESREPVRRVPSLERCETNIVSWWIGGEVGEEDVVEDGEVERALELVKQRVIGVRVEVVEEVWSGRKREE